MTTAALLWDLVNQAHHRAARADPDLAARHRRIETALAEAIKKKAVGGKPTAAAETSERTKSHDYFTTN